MAEEGGCGHFRHLARGPRRERQRGCCRHCQTEPGCHWLCGIDLRTPEQDLLCTRQELRWRIHQLQPRLRIGGGCHGQDSCGLPGLHHQCTRQGRLPHLHLHLAPGEPFHEGPRQEEGTPRLPDPVSYTHLTLP